VVTASGVFSSMSDACRYGGMERVTGHDSWGAWKDWCRQAEWMVVMVMWFRQWVTEEATSNVEVLKGVPNDNLILG
jgi:hypothetical protein